MIRVALSAPSLAVRERVSTMLRACGFELVSETEADGGEFAAVDVSVVAVDSHAAPADLVRDPGSPPVVLIGADSSLLGEAMETGVRAVLPGNCNADELAAAVQAAAAGLVAFPASQLPIFFEAVPASVETMPDTAHGALSPREVQVLQMMAEGLANKEIAWRLGISEHTVKFHVASILNRLDAGSRTQAVAIGLRRGIIML